MSNDSDSSPRPPESVPAPPSDHSLMRRFRGGQQDAATALYLRYAARLRALAQGQVAADLAPRLDSEDIVQSVFRTFFRRASLGQYDVPENEELWRLFLVIALHKIRSSATYHRAAKRDVRATVAVPAGSLGGRLACPDETDIADLRLLIDELLDGLPASMRPIVRLRIEGHEIQEIASLTGRSRRSVERALQEFRTRLGELIREDR